MMCDAPKGSKKSVLVPHRSSQCCRVDIVVGGLVLPWRLLSRLSARYEVTMKFPTHSTTRGLELTQVRGIVAVIIDRFET
jgi:hypothetical protein